MLLPMYFYINFSLSNTYIYKKYEHVNIQTICMLFVLDKLKT